MCVCVTLIRITRKQIIAKVLVCYLLFVLYTDATSNFFRWLPQFVYWDWGKQKNSKLFKSCGENFLLEHCYTFRLHLMDWKICIFSMLKNLQKENKVWIPFITCLQGHRKEFAYISENSWELLKFVLYYFMQFFNKFSLKNTVKCIRMCKQCTGETKIGKVGSFLPGI